MRVLVAFDKFKDALIAERACELACAAIQEQFPDHHVVGVPLTDGGEGFCGILTNAANGCFGKTVARNPRGESSTVRLGFIEAQKLSSLTRATGELPDAGRIAVIEMAAAAGLSCLAPEDRDPWETSTHGVGDMILRAVEDGVDGILLGIGGSATNDLGLGALQVLGLRFLDELGTVVERIRPSVWHRLVSIEGDLPELPPMRIACDVDNPLLGTFGATQVFGPQKGFSSQDLQRAEQGLDRVARLFVKSMGCDPAHFEELGAGAAGGLGFGLRTAAGASFVPGFSLVAAWLGLEEQIADADLVITGEGRFDCSSLRGKGPGTIAKMAAEAGKRVLVLAGSLEREAVEELNALHPSVRTREISCPDLSLAENLRQAPPRLVKVLQEWIETENWNLS